MCRFVSRASRPRVPRASCPRLPCRVLRFTGHVATRKTFAKHPGNLWHTGLHVLCQQLGGRRQEQVRVPCRATTPESVLSEAAGPQALVGPVHSAEPGGTPRLRLLSSAGKMPAPRAGGTPATRWLFTHAASFLAGTLQKPVELWRCYCRIAS